MFDEGSREGDGARVVVCRYKYLGKNAQRDLSGVANLCVREEPGARLKKVQRADQREDAPVWDSRHARTIARGPPLRRFLVFGSPMKQFTTSNARHLREPSMTAQCVDSIDEEAEAAERDKSCEKRDSEKAPDIDGAFTCEVDVE